MMSVKNIFCIDRLTDEYQPLADLLYRYGASKRNSNCNGVASVLISIGLCDMQVLEVDLDVGKRKAKCAKLAGMWGKVKENEIDNKKKTEIFDALRKIISIRPKISFQAFLILVAVKSKKLSSITDIFNFLGDAIANETNKTALRRTLEDFAELGVLEIIKIEDQKELIILDVENV